MTFVWQKIICLTPAPLYLFHQGRNEGGKGGTISRRRITMGAPSDCGNRRKVPTMSQVLSSMQYICFRKTLSSNMGSHKLASCPGRHPISLCPCISHLFSAILVEWMTFYSSMYYVWMTFNRDYPLLVNNISNTTFMQKLCVFLLTFVVSAEVDLSTQARSQHTSSI